MHQNIFISDNSSVDLSTLRADLGKLSTISVPSTKRTGRHNILSSGDSSDSSIQQQSEWQPSLDPIDHAFAILGSSKTPQSREVRLYSEDNFSMSQNPPFTDRAPRLTSSIKDSDRSNTTFHELIDRLTAAAKVLKDLEQSVSYSEK